jgi:multidrug resistance efflux pump
VSSVRAALGLCAIAACHRATPSAVPVVEVRQQRLVRTVDAEGYLKPVRATPVTVPSDIQWPLRVVWLGADGAQVDKGDVVARFDDLELRSRLAAAQSDRTSAVAKKQKEAVLSTSAAAERKRGTAAAARELDLTRAFQRRDSAIFSRDQIVEAEIDETLQSAKLAHARNSESIDRQVGRSKINLIEVEAEKAAEAIRRSQKGLGALEIRAPHEGILMIKRNYIGEPARVGDTVWRSQTIAEVSRVAEMEAEIFVLEAEAAGLAKGKRADLVVEAQPDRIFKATVQRVETVAKRREPKSPTQYFGAILALERTETTLMKPGQRVRVRLLLAEQDALVVPRPSLFDRNGIWVAYRREGTGFAAVPVKLGPSTGGLVAIESGLRPHDYVALRDPGKTVEDILAAPASKPAGGR